MRYIEDKLTQSEKEECASKTKRRQIGAMDLRKMTEDERKTFGDYYDESYADRFMENYLSLQTSLRKVCIHF